MADATIDPPPTLLIAGAGHVGQALARVVSRLGFDVVVIDDRADLASPARFPESRMVVGEIDTELRRFPIDSRTYVVIVTRGHKHDGQALAAVVDSPARYVGLIGSKRKIHKIYEDLEHAGIAREMLERVYAPIGLDIAAVSVEEIALSIAAELVAVKRGRGGMAAEPMKLRRERKE